MFDSHSSKLNLITQISILIRTIKSNLVLWNYHNAQYECLIYVIIIYNISLKH